MAPRKKDAQAGVVPSVCSCSGSEVLLLEVLSTLRQILSLLVDVSPEHLVKKWEKKNAQRPVNRVD